MKKKVVIIIIFLLLAAGAWVIFTGPSSKQYFPKPDQMQVIIYGKVTEITSKEEAFDQIYKMMNEAWETSTIDHGKPLMIMFTHLDEENLAKTSVEIRFIYEKDIKMDKGSERVSGNTLSFFPFELECAAFSRNANYQSSAVVYVFSLSEEQQAELEVLIRDLN